MATFDVDGYRKAAKAAGISNAEIENEIKFQTSAPAKSDPFEKDGGGFKLGSLEQVQERLGNDWWHLPAGLAVVGAAAYGAEKLMGGFGKTEALPEGPRIDPTMAPEPIAQQPIEPVKPSLPQQTNLTPEDLQARAAVLKAGPVAPPAPQAPAPTYTAPIPMTTAELDAAFAAQNPISTPISAAPIDAPAPTPSAAPNSPVTSVVVDELKEMLQEDVTKPVAPPGELRTGTGKPAFAGQGPAAALNKKGEPKFKPEYADIKSVPVDYAFVPGAQYIDTPRQNIGQVEYTKAYTNQPFPLTNEQAIQESKDINRLLGRATRAEAAAAGLAPAEITPGITKKTSAGTKPVRVAGTVGALMAISDLAKAETPGQRGMAGANLLEAVLPPGFMMGGAGAGSSNVPNMGSAALLGSPYAQTEVAQRARRDQEMTRRIAGRTGAAVPPQFRR